MIRASLALILVATITCGCASVGGARPVSPTVASYADRPRDMPVRHADGSLASWSEMVAACAGADAVLVGESHGHPLGLPAAAALWEDVLAAAPKSALALEFWERDEQVDLEDAAAGIENPEVKRKRGDPGKSLDASYPPGHEQMVQAAHKAKRPVVAANAPRRYVRLARTEGFDRLRALSPTQAATFRIPDRLIEGRYREDFGKVMAGEKGEQPSESGGREFDAMFRSQQVWDWTMAESVARALDAGAAPTLLVVGRFHVEHTGGLTQALKSIRPATRCVTVAFIDEEPPATFPDAHKGRADFILYTGAR
ncbi:MAG: ChaN family lipoprotein [Planctomycetes bacterium]|nr:ChaN family lipoprotein [Planctomycetota bacterium]